jgi:hypothetical protein
VNITNYLILAKKPGRVGKRVSRSQTLFSRSQTLFGNAFLDAPRRTVSLVFSFPNSVWECLQKRSALYHLSDAEHQGRHSQYKYNLDKQLIQSKIKGARVELFFKHYNLYKNPRLKIKLSLAPFLFTYYFHTTLNSHF